MEVGFRGLERAWRQGGWEKGGFVVEKKRERRGECWGGGRGREAYFHVCREGVARGWRRRRAKAVGAANATRMDVCPGEIVVLR